MLTQSSMTGSSVAQSRPARRRRMAFRALLAAVVTAAAFTGFMGFLHTPQGRPLMAMLGLGCPVGAATPAQVESLRMRGVGELRGATRAPTRPALGLGLTLDVSRQADVEAWARARGLDCLSKEKPSRAVICRAVPASALSAQGTGGPLDDLTFSFAPDQRLVAVETFRRSLTGTEAATLFGQIAGTLKATLEPAAEAGKVPGAPVGETVGEATPAYLDGAPMHTARLRYRFSDYLATVTAMNLSGRVALREQYQSAL